MVTTTSEVHRRHVAAVLELDILHTGPPLGQKFSSFFGPKIAVVVVELEEETVARLSGRFDEPAKFAVFHLIDRL